MKKASLFISAAFLRRPDIQLIGQLIRHTHTEELRRNFWPFKNVRRRLLACFELSNFVEVADKVKGSLKVFGSKKKLPKLKLKSQFQWRFGGMLAARCPVGHQKN